MSTVARDISYSHSAQSRVGRAVIRGIENATGRGKLIRRAQGYEAELAQGADFWTVMTQRYGVSLDIMAGSLASIPRTGPLLVVANHPFGILDGLILGHILNQVRDDFKILANAVFCKATDLNDAILPVNFETSKQAVAQNLAMRKQAIGYMKQGGAIGIFPGGTVSTALNPLGPPHDPVWRSFAAKLVSTSQARVVPLYFDGSNSRLFQLASHTHPSLRLGLLISEFKRKLGQPVRVAIGNPLDQRALQKYAQNPKAMMDFLRQSTYDLSPSSCGAATPYGYMF